MHVWVFILAYEGLIMQFELRFVACIECLLILVLAHQLDKNLQGRLTWSAGMHSSMNATLVWDRDQHHVVSSVQVNISFIFMGYFAWTC